MHSKITMWFDKYYVFFITVNFASGLSYATLLYGHAASQVRLI